MVNNFDQPKNGRFFCVLGVCRTSSSQQQAGSIAEQERLLRQHLNNLFGKKRFELCLQKCVGTGVGSFEDLQTEVEVGNYDIVIADNAARISRNVNTLEFFDSAEKHETRVIAISDGIDTGRAMSWWSGSLLKTLAKLVAKTRHI